MTGIFTAKATPGRPRCARCGRLFTPAKEGQRYGPTCARKMQLNHIEVKNMKGETLAVIV